jgi:ATP-dependent Zn protease
MDSETPTWVTLLTSWVPILILVGFWIWFMRKGGMIGKGGTLSKQAQYMERNMAFMDRQEQLLERIAAALEQRNKT